MHVKMSSYLYAMKRPFAFPTSINRYRHGGGQPVGKYGGSKGFWIKIGGGADGRGGGEKIWILGGGTRKK